MLRFCFRVIDKAVNILIFSIYFDISYHMTIILLTSIVLILLGALDDAIELGVTFRLLTQLVCCLIVIGSGLLVSNLGNYMFLPNIEIGILTLFSLNSDFISAR